ncbi:aminotransferase class I/II-fold pyridoxal phosphate-dependent enzyme [Mesorhizobium sp. LHD-90]|uniref:aminotransferase class I/II-fold pyridoxal phosphate-dependent enzyme n=1 Tax=Mesorhizobium sp. LHD-90 TaxID=3071414 RepID=UPI0027E15C0E|nr:aminotransferase class I/II-fold pyridoxal phosphate-dependent enzyme [Mesorhizobium sp. LHD-90]MDQ6434986.1 aminotransferase class I/II-fold pyridoxal phosphate-dependent enzyme [Mesorhizobium sp. LHD-90]
MTDGANQNSRAVRDQVLSFMKDHARPAGGKRAARPAVAPQVNLAPAFTDLPEHKQIVAQAAAGDQLGIDNPFFRSHAGAAGATTVVDGRTLINFASYDYLGMNRHAEVLSAAKNAVDRYGISASASRLVAGERPIHGELESKIAGFYGVESAIVFVSGYLTNVATIGTLLGPEDLVIHDEFIHNSALIGAKLSGSHRRLFRHNDMDDLERVLRSVTGRHRRVLVVVEGVYSMDGDVADLPRLIELRSQYGFWLMVDDAHALGVIGDTGRGTAEYHGCNPRDVDIWMGTLSKTTASCGGYVAGSEALVTLLKGSAGGFIYSVGLAPALAAAAWTSLDLIDREPERVARMRRNGHLFYELARKRGLDTGVSVGCSVIPVIIGDSLRAAQLSNDLMATGINVMPIIHPAVPEGLARLRFFITSEHTPEQIDYAVTQTAEKLEALVERNFGIGSVDIEAVLRRMAAEA